MVKIPPFVLGYNIHPLGQFKETMVSGTLYRLLGVVLFSVTIYSIGIPFLRVKTFFSIIWTQWTPLFLDFYPTFALVFVSLCELLYFSLGRFPLCERTQREKTHLTV